MKFFDPTHVPPTEKYREKRGETKGDGFAPLICYCSNAGREGFKRPLDLGKPRDTTRLALDVLDDAAEKPKLAFAFGAMIEQLLMGWTGQVLVQGPQRSVCSLAEVALVRRAVP